MALHLENWVGGPLSNNIYLLWDDLARVAVLIDPSIESEPALRRVRELEAQGVRLQAIWNTHGHFDHVYDNARWKREYSAVPIRMHSADIFLMEHLREQAIWFGMEAPEAVLPDEDWAGIEEIEIGEHTAKVLHTPGHSPGSVSFWCPDEKLCISGDVLFQGSVGRTDLPGCSLDELAVSLQTLGELPPETRILPGHGPATTLADEQATNAYYQKLTNSTVSL